MPETKVYNVSDIEVIECADKTYEYVVGSEDNESDEEMLKVYYNDTVHPVKLVFCDKFDIKTGNGVIGTLILKKYGRIRFMRAVEGKGVFIKFGDVEYNIELDEGVTRFEFPQELDDGQTKKIIITSGDTKSKKIDIYLGERLLAHMPSNKCEVRIAYYNHESINVIIFEKENVLD